MDSIIIYILGITLVGFVIFQSAYFLNKLEFCDLGQKCDTMVKNLQMRLDHAHANC
jgi:hypothetical protein